MVAKVFLIALGRVNETMNTLKVGILLVALTAVFLLIGRAIGGTMGMVIALVLALAMNFGSYWFSDKLVLRMTGAQPVPEGSSAAGDELHEMVGRLARNAGIPKPAVYVVNDPSPNAFATGRNPERGVVAVNTGLMQILDRTELEGVVAHELAHIRSRDTLTMAVVASVAGGIMLLAQFAQIAAFFGGARDEEGGSNILVLLVAAIVAPLAATLVQLGISRAREYEADKHGAEIAGSPLGLANALRKLERGVDRIPGHTPPQAAHMCIVNPFGGVGGPMNLFRTHPTTEDRVQRLMSMR